MRILPDFAKPGRFGIIFIFALSALLSGCGIKTFPRPIGAPPAPRVNDLSARVEPGAVELSWSPLPAAQAKAIRYSILKSTVDWDKRNCLECPPPAQLQVHSIDAATAKPGPDGKLRWSDHAVCLHKALRYQIALINDHGQRVSLSNPAIAKIYAGAVAPTDLRATIQERGVLLEWKQTPRDIQGHPLKDTDLSFVVQMLSGRNVWTDVSPLVKGEAYYDQQVPPGSPATFRVVAVRSIDEENVYGEPSSTITVMGPKSAAPPPPAKVWMVPVHGGLEVHWIEDEGKTAGYYVYRKQGKEIVRLTANPISRPPYVDHGLSRGVTYSYAVSAVSAQPNHKEGLLSKWVSVRNLLTR
ncbi:MAG: hypothetical protein ACP5IL_15685 [Syntrophobacteraceae bacterium]